LVAGPVYGRSSVWHTKLDDALKSATAGKHLLVIAFTEGDQAPDLDETLLRKLPGLTFLKVPLTTRQDVGESPAQRKKKPVKRDERVAELLARLKCDHLRSLLIEPGFVIVGLKTPGANKKAKMLKSLRLKTEISDDVFLYAVDWARKKTGAETLVDENGLTWQTDYEKAIRLASESKKMLLIAFDSTRRRFRPHRRFKRQLSDFVLLRLGTNAKDKDGDAIMWQEPYGNLRLQPGLALLDYRNQQSETFETLRTVVKYSNLTEKGLGTLLKMRNPKADLRRELTWQTDYVQARSAAEKQGKMLLVAFDSDKQRYEPSPFVIPTLQDFVLVRMKVQDKIKNDDGKPRRLVDEPGFDYLGRQPGLAIVDLKHADREDIYGQVVSVLPHKYLTSQQGYSLFPRHEREYELMVLPALTITRRTLIWGVRVSTGHSASTRLRSADGHPHGHLLDQCKVWADSHPYRHMGDSAEIIHRISSSDIVDGALLLVDGWRGSPPHYALMLPFSDSYGYDMTDRGGNNWWGIGKFWGSGSPVGQRLEFLEKPQGEEGPSPMQYVSRPRRGRMAGRSGRRTPRR